SVVMLPRLLTCDLTLPPQESGSVTLTAAGQTDARYDWSIDETRLPDAGPTPSVTLGAGRHSVIVTASKGTLSATCTGVQIVFNPRVPEPARVASQIVWAGTTTYNVNP